MDNQKLEYWNIDKFIAYINNPRLNDQAVDRVASMIKEFGFRVPIIAKSDGLVVDGHLRLKCAKKLGLKELPVLIADDMTESQIKAFRIAINKSAELAGWDEELLKLEIEDLKDLDFDLDLLGFDENEINTILDEINFEPATEEEQGQLDELDPIWISCPHCGKEFDQRENH